MGAERDWRCSLVTRAVTARLIFALHLCACTVLLVMMNGALGQPSLYWIATVTATPLLAEGIFTLVKTRGRDWKWASPALLFYVAGGSVVAWLLERKAQQVDSQGVLACNNVSLYDSYDDFNGTADWESFCGCGHCNAAAEQLFLAALILGRWLLPKGDVPYASNDNVNYFLLHLAKVHCLLSMACNAADALDFINLVRHDSISGDTSTINMIFIVWSVSLCQFSLVTTATRRTKDGAVRILAETDGWSSLLCTALDDAPYLGLRVYFVCSRRTLTSTILFFMVKNVLTICATVQKLVAIYRMTSVKDVEEFITVEAPPPQLPPARQVIAVQPRQRGGVAGGGYEDEYDDRDLDVITLANKGSMLSVITRRARTDTPAGHRDEPAALAAADGGTNSTPSPAPDGAYRSAENVNDMASLLGGRDVGSRFQSRDPARSALNVDDRRESYPLVAVSDRAPTSMSTSSSVYFTHAYATAKEQETGDQPQKLPGKIKLPLGKALMSGLRSNGLIKAMHSAVDKAAKRVTAGGRRARSGGREGDGEVSETDDDRRVSRNAAGRSRGGSERGAGTGEYGEQRDDKAMSRKERGGDDDGERRGDKAKGEKSETDEPNNEKKGAKKERAAGKMAAAAAERPAKKDDDDEREGSDGGKQKKKRDRKKSKNADISETEEKARKEKEKDGEEHTRKHRKAVMAVEELE